MLGAPRGGRQWFIEYGKVVRDSVAEKLFDFFPREARSIQAGEIGREGRPTSRPFLKEETVPVHPAEGVVRNILIEWFVAWPEPAVGYSHDGHSFAMLVDVAPHWANAVSAVGPAS